MNIISDKHLNNFYLNKTNSCKSRGIRWRLTKDQCRELLQVECCAYTGIVMTLHPGGKAPRQPTDVTLERVDCSKPYTVANTIAVCNAANSAKAAFEGVYRDKSAEMIVKMAESLTRLEKKVVCEQTCEHVWPVTPVTVVKEYNPTLMQKIVGWVAKKMSVEL